jgi:hypothetical protein
MVSTFLLTGEITARAKEIAEFASKPVNWYRVGDPLIPGNVAAHVLVSGTTRAVFSWTVHPDHEGLVLRHLSVSVRREGALPLPEVVFTLAHLFGFTGANPQSEAGIVTKPAPTWQMAVNEDENTIVVQEAIKGPQAT